MIFIKIIISIILIIGIINPRLSWKISEGWKFKDVEPSTLYLIMTRVMSVVMLIVVWLAIPN
ncbi:DUF6199 family natural product biosynthesis protein [Clostridium sp. 'White wine YQ']|uniref:DUF6199 family natural product biosynthesis protein n=1 Tax=Clostridium sp. 'White wine YQ' TaxID=3027474 RepID=UPI002366940C|nr:DUF6199 family natural product biosynthesis protein [Clostridium sp. 'White wine YQ']MDD7796040.1 histidine kinase [Clostridium sp. 'White wine YQ']